MAGLSWGFLTGMNGRMIWGVCVGACASVRVCMRVCIYKKTGVWYIHCTCSYISPSTCFHPLPQAPSLPSPSLCLAASTIPHSLPSPSRSLSASILPHTIPSPSLPPSASTPFPRLSFESCHLTSSCPASRKHFTMSYHLCLSSGRSFTLHCLWVGVTRSGCEAGSGWTGCGCGRK